MLLTPECLDFERVINVLFYVLEILDEFVRVRSDRLINEFPRQRGDCVCLSFLRV